MDQHTVEKCEVFVLHLNELVNKLFGLFSACDLPDVLEGFFVLE